MTLVPSELVAALWKAGAVVSGTLLVTLVEARLTASLPFASGLPPEKWSSLMYGL
jgi:hypothetical protein